MVPSTLFCTNCGTPNRQESSFCFACGQPLQATVDEPSRSFPRVNTSTPLYPSTTGKLPPRSILKQRYRIVARVGYGGFGAVYKAEDMQFGDRLVAVKEMNRRGSEEQVMESATAAFKREALLLANLKHPSLPRFYDHFAEGGRLYLVMDYIEGETLETLLEKMRRFRVEDVLRIGVYLSDVLNYLHSQNPPVVFRDLKPANIIMTPRGQIYLIDFGLAHLFDPAYLGQSSSFGSPGYAAPEQYESIQTTVSVDIYSLGATLHQMLTGILPAIKPFEFAPLRFAPGTPMADLGMLIARMLELSPSRRPENMAVVLRELQRIVNQLRSMRAASGSASHRPANTPGLSGPASQSRAGISGASTGIPPTRSIPPPVTPGRTTPHMPRGNPSSSSGSGLIAPPVGTLFCLFEGHQDQVNGLAWSSNGTHLASVGSDGAARLWNTTTATPVAAYRSEQKQARTVAWSPDGSRLAIGYTGDKRDTETIHIILVTTGERIFTYSGGGSFWGAQDDRSINALAWSPDGARIAWGGGENKVEVWDAQMRRQLAVYKGHNSAVYALAWSHDGRQIASSGADDAVHIWDASTGRNAATFFKHSSVVTGVAWSSNGQRVATASHDRTALVWNAVTGTTLTTHRGHTDQVLALSWSPDGSRLATASRDGQAHIWDSSRGVNTYTYTGHVGSVNAISWSPDGKRIASAGADHTVHVWRAV